MSQTALPFDDPPGETAQPFVCGVGLCRWLTIYRGDVVSGFVLNRRVCSGCGATEELDDAEIG